MNVYLGSCDFFVLLIKAVIFWLIKLLLCELLLKNLIFFALLQTNHLVGLLCDSYFWSLLNSF